MGQNQAPSPSGIITRVKSTILVGAAAGNRTLTGIAYGDQGDSLIRVQSVIITLSEATPNTLVWTVADLTSEFSITADDTINNTGGTSSVRGFLIVEWYDRDFGDQTAATWV